MKTIENIKDINTIGGEIFNQLKATTSACVRMSWGMHSSQVVVEDGMAGLAFRVSGVYHKGWVIILYNIANDTYTIRFKNIRKALKKEVTDVYFDEMGDLIDRIVERGETDIETYAKRAFADSARKMR